MSMFSSRRQVLSAAGTAVAGAVSGCAATTDSDEIDITVSNASDAPIDYEVMVNGFEETGVIEAGGSDQYENELGQTGSSSQFEVVAVFDLQIPDDQTGTDRSGNRTDRNGTDTADPRAQRFESAISAHSAVRAVSVTYTGGQMVVNPVLESNDA